MTQAITQAATEVIKAAIMTVREVETLNYIILLQTVTIVSSPTLKQPALNSKMPGKYYKLCNSETEVKNIF